MRNRRRYKILRQNIEKESQEDWNKKVGGGGGGGGGKKKNENRRNREEKRERGRIKEGIKY